MDYKLSPSTLNLFKECPRCFWLQFHGARRPSGIFPSLPSGMDKVLKEHFDRFMEKGSLPPEILKCPELSSCSLFDDKEKLKVWRSNFKGIQWTDPESGVLLRGAVDNILKRGGRLIVLDYKTRGYPLKEDTHEHYRLQMNLYNFLLRKNGYRTEDASYLLFYYPSHVADNGDVAFHTKLVRMDVDIASAESVFRKAVDVLKMDDAPDPGEGCEWCGFRG